jgi:predicted MFS family arabinose efflux permease
MHGIGGRAGWAWIFILEGLFSIVMGIAGFFLVPSTPRGSRFLTDGEKVIIERRLAKDRPSIEPAERFSPTEVLRSLKSPHVILSFIIFFMIGTTLYGLALFLASIVNQLGFSATRTQLLSVGPFAAGFFVTLLAAYLSDRHKTRAIPIAMLAVIAVIGYGVYLSAKKQVCRLWISISHCSGRVRNSSNHGGMDG